jgi:hypothetical protein
MIQLIIKLSLLLLLLLLLPTIIITANNSPSANTQPFEWNEFIKQETTNATDSDSRVKFNFLSGSGFFVVTRHSTIINY